MTETLRNIIAPKLVEDSQTTQFTVDTSQTETPKVVIDAFVIVNVSSSDAIFNCNLVTSGDVAGLDNLVLPNRNIAPNEVYLCPELVGQVLEMGGSISTKASAPETFVIRVSAREITT